MPEIKRISYFDDRFYKITSETLIEGLTAYEGKDGSFDYYLPSTTTKHGVVNKPFLAQWRGQVGNEEADRIMNQASARGSRIHYAVEVLLNGGIVEYKQQFNEVEVGE